MTETDRKRIISIETIVQLPILRVWELWTEPEHIKKWNFLVENWYCPSAKNDLRQGGGFSLRMEAKEGSMGFNLYGMYEQVIPNKRIVCKLSDGRQVSIEFEGFHRYTRIAKTFEVEDSNSIEEQRAGWQGVLDNFKKYAEGGNL